MNFTTGLKTYENKTIDNFTSIQGLRIRRMLNPLLRPVLKKATKGTLIIESYPQLEKNKPYIFVSTHYFSEDIIAALATIDRNAYALVGTTDQLEHNPQMYAAWLNGLIYVDRLDNESRRQSVKKMEYVLNNGSSILIFAEGGWNNTENLLVQKLFSGPYTLSRKTNIPVVPISSFFEPESNTIYVRAGSPINLFEYADKQEALNDLRDSLATMMFEEIKAHSVPLVRAELPEDYHLAFMEQRKREYLKVRWTRDVWDEELTVYKDKNHPAPEEVRSSLDNVTITKSNYHLIAPVRVRRLEDERYNFKKYMHENWNK